MRRITVWALSTITVVVLLFSYRTSTSSGAAGSVVASGTLAANGTTPDGSSGGSAVTPSLAPTPSGGAARTYTGDAVSTRYGPVQVQITVAGGKVTKSEVTQVPWSERRDQEINAQAVPILNQEAVQAQSASIDMVSGATYTSDGYLHSLQSALDQAKL